MKKIVILPLFIFLTLSVFAIEGGTIENGDFESLSAGGFPAAWTAGGQAETGTNLLVSENAYSGNHSLHFYDIESETWTIDVTQSVTGLICGAGYELSGYLNMAAPGSVGAVLKVECYSNPGLPDYRLTGQMSFTADTYEVGVWSRQALEFTVPADTYCVVIAVRMVGGGELFWDNIALTMTSLYISKLDTDQVFYYTDAATGSAVLYTNELLQGELEGAAVEFTLSDGSEILLSESKPLENGAASFTYSLDLLTEKKKAYILTAALHQYSIREEASVRIYKYDKPQMITDGGECIVNGEVFLPAFAYHVRENHYAACKAAGINVIQNAMYDTADEYVTALDRAQNAGLMMLVPLYRNMKPAGHANNEEFTRQVVSAIQSHPALFAYMIMDEPYFHNPNADEDLENSYKIIRDIDDVHPVFVMEYFKFESSVKYADILGADLYAAAYDTPLSESISENTALAMAATRGEKPLWVLLQAFDYEGYFPSQSELRGAIYQAMMGGAKGVGFFRVANAVGTMPLTNTLLWSTITEFCNTGEYALLANRTNAVYTEDNTETRYTRIYRDGVKTTVQILNRTMEENHIVLKIDDYDRGYKIINKYGEGTSYVHKEYLYVTLPSASAATILLERDDLILLNSSFEEDNYAWNVVEKTGGTAEILNTGGNFCAKLTGTAGTAWVTQYTNLQSGSLPYGYGMTRFRISFNYKTETPGALPAIKLYELSGTGVETDLTVTKRQTITESGGWTTYIYYSAPTSAAAAGVGLMLRGSGEGVTVYYDDVALTASDFWIYDNNICEVNTLVSGQKINVSAIFPNRTGAVSNVEVLVAFYEVTEGAMRLIALYKNTASNIAPDNSAEIRVTGMETPLFDSGTEMRMEVFVWKGLDSLIPHKTGYTMRNNP